MYSTETRACRSTLEIEHQCDLADLRVPTRCHCEGGRRAASLIPPSAIAGQGFLIVAWQAVSVAGLVCVVPSANVLEEGN